MSAVEFNLILIVVGVGFLKPNISTMVGGLYKVGDNKRDTGFYIFYMGINLGAFFGALTVGAVAAKYGWHYGFSLAGLGMIIGQVTFFCGRKNFKKIKKNQLFVWSKLVEKGLKMCILTSWMVPR